MNTPFQDGHGPPGDDHSGKERSGDERLFAGLLAYISGQLGDPAGCAEIRGLIETDRRWKTHYDSIMFLDLERAAAHRDREDIEVLLEQWKSGAKSPQDFCETVAETKGAVFDPLIRGESRAGEGRTRQQWAEHVDQCVFCRRMRRLRRAELQKEMLGEPLLCDRVLAPSLVEMRNGVLERAIRWFAKRSRQDVPATGKGVRLVRFLQRFLERLATRRPIIQRAILACAASVLIGVSVGAGAVSVSWWRAVAGGIEEAKLDEPVQWAIEGAPVVVSDGRAIVKGRAWNRRIEKIRVEVTPGLEGHKQWTKEYPIHAKGLELVPFEIDFESPRDNRIRVIHVEAVVAAEIRDDPTLKKRLKWDDLDYETRIACRPKGIILDYPPGGPAEVVDASLVRGVWHVAIRTNTSAGFATIAVRERGAGQYMFLPPQTISDSGQKLVFQVSQGEDVGWFTVTTFASEAGSDVSLMHAIEHHQFAALEVGEPYKVTVPSPDRPTAAP